MNVRLMMTVVIAVAIAADIAVIDADIVAVADKSNTVVVIALCIGAALVVDNVDIAVVLAVADNIDIAVVLAAVDIIDIDFVEDIVVVNTVVVDTAVADTVADMVDTAADKAVVEGT
jgi:hypothetical protein